MDGRVKTADDCYTYSKSFAEFWSSKLELYCKSLWTEDTKQKSGRAHTRL